MLATTLSWKIEECDAHGQVMVAGQTPLNFTSKPQADDDRIPPKETSFSFLLYPAVPGYIYHVPPSIDTLQQGRELVYPWEQRRTGGVRHRAMREHCLHSTTMKTTPPFPPVPECQEILAWCILFFPSQPFSTMAEVLFCCIYHYTIIQSYILFKVIFYIVIGIKSHSNAMYVFSTSLFITRCLTCTVWRHPFRDCQL